jgi:ankyrin repeat protein
LIGAGAELDVFDAAAVGDASRLEQLLAQHPDLVDSPSPDGFFPLGLAAFFGHVDAVKLLLARGAEVGRAAHNAMKVQPLHSAVAGRNFVIVQLLVDAGAPINAPQQEGWTPLHTAVHNQDVEMVRYLLAHGADPRHQNDAGQSAIGIAAEAGATEILKLLKGPSH